MNETIQGLTVNDIYKSFEGANALNGVSFHISMGEILAVLGPSGCGKSTLLSIIAGLEQPDRGDIDWDGRSLKEVPTYQRGFGLMFQDFALFPHLNAFENVSFGLRMSGLDPVEIRERVAQMLSLVGLVGFEARDVNTLSGGEQQRIALARSLAPHPRLLMLDEPLGSLDRTLRERLILDLRQILAGMHQTTLYVTHDQEEAFTLADRVVVMNSGRVEQIGTPQEIYRRPASLFVARFLGFNNLLPGKIVQQDSSSILESPIGRFPIRQPGSGEVMVLLRPDSMRLDGQGTERLHGKVMENSFRGNTYRTIVDVSGYRLEFDFLSNISLPAPRSSIDLSFYPQEAIQVFPLKN